MLKGRAGDDVDEEDNIPLASELPAAVHEATLRVKRKREAKRAPDAAKAQDEVSKAKPSRKKPATSRQSSALASQGSPSTRSGERKEPKEVADRFACRLYAFGAFILKESSTWSPEICHLIRLLWTALVQWEIVNSFTEGACVPGLSTQMHNNVSKNRFATKFQNVWKEDPNCRRSLAGFFDALRKLPLEDFLEMHGTHGPAAAARALLDARGSDPAFEADFIALARELTDLLDVAARSVNRLPGSAEKSIKILHILMARNSEQTGAVTQLLDRMLERGTGPSSKGRKREGRGIGSFPSAKKPRKSDG